MPPFDTKDYGFVDVPKVCLDTINKNVINWSEEQEDTTIHPANYVNTTYNVASNGTAGLSTYNFNLNRKNKLEGIESNAQVNVKSDWNSESGNSQILNKPTIVDWRDSYVINVPTIGNVQQTININNIPSLPYVSNTTFNSYKSIVETSFNLVDSSLNNMSKDITDNYDFIVSVKSTADDNEIDISNLDNSFNNFKLSVESSFNIIDASLNNIILDISTLENSFNSLPNFIDWTVEQNNDIHINNIPDLPYALDASLDEVILDLSNLDHSFNNFKLSVESSFNIIDASLDDIITDISILDYYVSNLPAIIDWTVEQNNDIHINNIPDLPYALDASLDEVILDLSNLDNSFNNFKSSVDSSLNNIIMDISLIDNSINDIILDISTLDFSFSALSRVFDRVVIIEASLNDIIDDIDDILPDINSNNLAHVLTSSGNPSSGAVWLPAVTLNINDNFVPEATTGTVASTLGVFNYTQPKIINLEVSANNYLEISDANLIVNGDTSLNGILNISGDVFLNGVNLNPSVTGDVTLDASYVNVDVCLNVPHIASGTSDVYMEFSTRDNNNVINLVAADVNTGLRYIEIKDDMLSARRFAPFGNVATNLVLNNDGGNVVVKNDLEVQNAIKLNNHIVTSAFSIASHENANWTTIKTISLSNRGNGWNTIGCHVRYCVRNSSGSSNAGTTHGIGEAFRTLTYDGATLNGDDVELIRYNTHGSNDSAKKFRVHLNDTDSMSIQYQNSVSNITTSITGTIEFQCCFANITIS